MSDYEVGQQPPVPTDGPSVHDLVVSDLVSRKLFGLAKYGTTLQAGNGRDALKDAYEEALDLAAYLRQAIEERDAQRRRRPAQGEADPDSPQGALRMHLIHCHDAVLDGGVLTASSTRLVQLHLDEHRLRHPAHEYQPWGWK